jgi:hypothetical protein
MNQSSTTRVLTSMNQVPELGSAFSQQPFQFDDDGHKASLKNACRHVSLAIWGEYLTARNVNHILILISPDR